MKAAHRLGTIAAILVAVSACEKSGTPVITLLTGVQSLSVVIGPGPGSTDVCDSGQLTLSVQTPAGATVFPDSTKWWSSDTTAISISQTGFIHALKVTVADTMRATVWSGAQAGIGQLVWSVEDARDPIGPCPVDGSPTPCIVPCGWHRPSAMLPRTDDGTMPVFSKRRSLS